MWNVSSRRDVWVGKRAARVFDGERIEGMISASWTGEGDESPSMWHMLHDDGDDEDLSPEETRAAVLRYGAQPASIFAVTVASTHGPTRRVR